MLSYVDDGPNVWEDWQWVKQMLGTPPPTNQRRRILGEDHPETLATQKALEELRRGRIVDARHLA